MPPLFLLYFDYNTTKNKFFAFFLFSIDKTFFLLYYLSCVTFVSVAQLDRASDYGSEGRVFESCHSQQKPFFQTAFLISI